MPCSMTGLSVSTGDVVAIQAFRVTNPNGHFLGVDLQIDLTPVPAPTTLALLFAGCAGVFLRKRRKNPSG